jgi:putative toxin-antitoxin system antitoxin component (TIGR02293 family)
MRPRDAILFHISGKWHHAMRKAKQHHRRKSPLRRPPALPPSGFAEATANPLAAEQAVETTISPGRVPHCPAVRAMPAALADLTQHGFSEEEIWALVVPKRTLARRIAGDEPLTVEETDKAIRLERIAALADRVFGDPAKARRWLRKPKTMLNGATPVAFLASETGARTVEEMLYQIQHGMFA